MPLYRYPGSVAGSNIPVVTLAELPDVGPAGEQILVSDLGGGAGILYSNGFQWCRLKETGHGGFATSDANYTVQCLRDPPIIRHPVALTANRTITLSKTLAYRGARFLVSRGVTSTGGFTLSVGGLKTLAVSKWALVEFFLSPGEADPTQGDWNLIASGDV